MSTHSNLLNSLNYSVNGSIANLSTQMPKIEANAHALLKSALINEQVELNKITNSQKLDVSVTRKDNIKFKLCSVADKDHRHYDILNKNDLEYNLIEQMESNDKAVKLSNLLIIDSPNIHDKMRNLAAFTFHIANNCNIDSYDKTNLQDKKDIVLIMQSIYIQKLCQALSDLNDKMQIQNTALFNTININSRIIDLLSLVDIDAIKADIKKMQDDLGSTSKSILAQNEIVNKFLKTKTTGMKAVASDVCKAKIAEFEYKINNSFMKEINDIKDKKIINSLIMEEESQQNDNNKFSNEDLHKQILNNQQYNLTMLNNYENRMRDIIKNYFNPLNDLIKSIEDKINNHIDSNLDDMEQRLNKFEIALNDKDEINNSDFAEITKDIEYCKSNYLEIKKEIKDKINNLNKDMINQIKQVKEDNEKKFTEKINKAQLNNAKRIDDNSKTIINMESKITKSINSFEQSQKKFTEFSDSIVKKVSSLCSTEELNKLKQFSQDISRELKESIKESKEKGCNRKFQTDVKLEIDQIKNKNNQIEINLDILTSKVQSDTKLISELSNKIFKNKEDTLNMFEKLSKMNNDNLINLKKSNITDVNNILEKFKNSINEDFSNQFDSYKDSINESINKINKLDKEEIKEPLNLEDEEIIKQINIDIKNIKENFKNQCLQDKTAIDNLNNNNNKLIDFMSNSKITHEHINQELNKVQSELKSMLDKTQQMNLNKIEENNKSQNYINNELNKFKSDYTNSLNKAKSDWNTKIDKLKEDLNKHDSNLHDKTKNNVQVMLEQWKKENLDNINNQMNELVNNYINNEDTNKNINKEKNDSNDINNIKNDISTNLENLKDKEKAEELDLRENDLLNSNNNINNDLEDDSSSRIDFKKIKENLKILRENHREIFFLGSYNFDVYHQNIHPDKWKKMSSKEKRDFYIKRNVWKENMNKVIEQKMKQGNKIQANELKQLMEFYSDKIPGPNIDKDCNDYTILTKKGREKKQEKKLVINNSSKYNNQNTNVNMNYKNKNNKNNNNNKNKNNNNTYQNNSNNHNNNNNNRQYTEKNFRNGKFNNKFKNRNQRNQKNQRYQGTNQKRLYRNRNRFQNQKFNNRNQFMNNMSNMNINNMNKMNYLRNNNRFNNMNSQNSQNQLMKAMILSNFL